MVSAIQMPVMGKTQEAESKTNTTGISINALDIKNALNSVHNNTTPNYVKLSERQLNGALKNLPGWTILDGKLHKTFTFVDFSSLFDFMYQVARSSQILNHHPNMTSTWNTLTLDYDTWSLGHVISNVDLKAAHVVEYLYQKGNYSNNSN